MREPYLKKWQKAIFLGLSAGMIFFSIIYLFNISIKGIRLYNVSYYYILIGWSLACAFLILPGREKDLKKVPWYDLLFAALSFGITLYFVIMGWEISRVGWVPAPHNYINILSLIMFLLILECTRRAAGYGLLIVTVVVGLYPLIAEKVPGAFGGMGFPFDLLVSYYSFSSEGMLGLPSRTIGDLLIGFLVFAGILVGVGAGDFFINISTSLLGKYRGGPAKVAVLSSAFFGALSGSALSNVAGTGSFTIPAMKKLGYPSHVAGSIEACSSTGGVLMPPVMGAIVFVMAMVLNESYVTVMLAAIIPSLLYFSTLLFQVDFFAAKNGIKGLSEAEIPSAKEVLKKGWFFLAVIVFLVYGLVYLRWENMAPFYASGMLILLSFLNKDTMLTPKRFLGCISQIGNLITMTMAIMLPVGFIMGGMAITGVGVVFTQGLVSLAGENIYLLLILGLLACYLMGMAGLMVTAYIILSISVAPALLTLAPELNVIAVHLAICYFAILAIITPPVATASFLAANIARAKPMSTAFASMKFGLAIYFVPFFFVFNPNLIMQGAPFDIIVSTLFCLLGLLLLAGGVSGYFYGLEKLNLPLRIAFMATGFIIALPEIITSLIGCAMVVIVLLINNFWKRRRILAQ